MTKDQYKQAMHIAERIRNSNDISTNEFVLLSIIDDLVDRLCEARLAHDRLLSKQNAERENKS